MGLQGTDTNRGPSGYSSDKNGFTSAEMSGLPAPLLVDRVSLGPWAIVSRRGGAIEVRRIGGASLAEIQRNPERYPLAWRDRNHMMMPVASMLVQRFNGYEMAREFPPKPMA